MFKLKSPCKDCPFRNDKPHLKRWLGEERADEIYQSLKDGNVFPCHKTTNLEESDEQYDEDGNLVESPYQLESQNQFCAGALILLEKTKDADRSRAVVTGEMLGLYKRSELKIENSPVFDTRDEFVNWHKR